MGNSVLIPLAAALVGSGGIGTFLGLLVQRRQSTMVNNASLVGIAIEGLTTRIQDQRAEISAKDARIADLEAQLTRKSRRPT